MKIFKRGTGERRKRVANKGKIADEARGESGRKREKGGKGRPFSPRGKLILARSPGRFGRVTVPESRSN